MRKQSLPAPGGPPVTEVCATLEPKLDVEGISLQTVYAPQGRGVKQCGWQSNNVDFSGKKSTMDSPSPTFIRDSGPGTLWEITVDVAPVKTANKLYLILLNCNSIL